MGQEIEKTEFAPEDFALFHRHLQVETEMLWELERQGGLASSPPVAGLELEAWLVDQALRPAPINDRYLARLNDPLACPELARFNIELNVVPQPLRGDALSRLHRDLAELWQRAETIADELGARLLMIGILPTLQESDLSLANMSPLNRYRALNEQVLKLRGSPLHLEITGHEHLECCHDDVMLEAGTTSFQLHLQAPLDQAVALYNASLLASAATVAAGANSPYLFGKDLWAETRIPLFEQAVEIGGVGSAGSGPLKRVGFGTGYARRYLSEVFRENREHFPVLLPIVFQELPRRFAHLRLHNGTIWRWNRPLIGFDKDGVPHFRIEHRVIPSGPTLIDMIANAALYYGLTWNLSHEPIPIPFTQARDNFYQAARHGLDAHVVWTRERRWRLRHLLVDEFLPRARKGLEQLGAGGEGSFYLDLILERILADQTGSQWQRRYIAAHGRDFVAMTRAYLAHQRQGQPVHTWKI